MNYTLPNPQDLEEVLSKGEKYYYEHYTQDMNLEQATFLYRVLETASLVLQTKEAHKIIIPQQKVIPTLSGVFCMELEENLEDMYKDLLCHFAFDTEPNKYIFYLTYRTVKWANIRLSKGDS